MNRASVIIREATAADADAVAAIAQHAVRSSEALLSAGAKLMLDSSPSQPDFAAILSNPEFRTVLAVDSADEVIIGLAVMSEDLFSSLIGRPCVHVHYLMVLDAQRHRGVGRELLSDATRFADEIDAESVVVGLWTEAREVNRYFAKVGFTPVTRRRIAPVSTLRRTLGLELPAVARATARRRLRAGP